jgi:hypothetical protein
MTKPRAGFSEEILKDLEDTLPAFFVRTDAYKATNGLISQTTLAMLAQKKEGPKYYLMGRKACYRKKDFLEWMERYYREMEWALNEGSESACD